MTAHVWDAELYDARHSFVAAHGTALLDLLNAAPGERVLTPGAAPETMWPSSRPPGWMSSA